MSPRNFRSKVTPEPPCYAQISDGSDDQVHWDNWFRDYAAYRLNAYPTMSTSTLIQNAATRVRSTIICLYSSE